MATAGRGQKITIIGNIGAGKTSLVTALAANGYVEVPEPVTDNPFFAAFCADPKANAEIMQAWMVMDRYAGYVSTITKDRKVVYDLCFPYDCAFVYCNHAQGNISDDFCAEYFRLVDYAMRCMPVPDTTVMLEVGPQTCLERIRRRNRTGEEGLTVEYLSAVADGYTRAHTLTREWGIRPMHLNWERARTPVQIDQLADFIEDIWWDTPAASPALPVDVDARADAMRGFFKNVAERKGVLVTPSMFRRRDN